MIITLKGADFSASNIGTLSSWRITRSLGSGATYEGVTSVDKGAAFSATVTLAEGYEIGTAGVTITMGGTVLSGAHSISGNVITITIAAVTGNVLIKVPTINTATGEEEEPEVPDTPVTPVVGYNLFNKNDPDIITDKSLKETGTLQTLTSNYGASGYIPCKKDDIVRAGRYLDSVWTANNNVVACFYDADKNFINGVAKATDPGDGDRYYKPTKDNTAYIRVSVKLNYIDYFMVTINQDAPPTEYIPYGQ